MLMYSCIDCTCGMTHPSRRCGHCQRVRLKRRNRKLAALLFVLAILSQLVAFEMNIPALVVGALLVLPALVFFVRSFGRLAEHVCR